MEGLPMKKIGFLVITAILMGGGTASAAEQFGVWYGVNAGASANWQTSFNIFNTGTTSQTATVTFYTSGGTLISSTSTTLAPNALWNFGTVNIGSITTSTLTSNTPSARGVAVISGTDINGYVTQWNYTTQAGFNFRIIDNASHN